MFKQTVEFVLTFCSSVCCSICYVLIRSMYLRWFRILEYTLPGVPGKHKNTSPLTVVIDQHRSVPLGKKIVLSVDALLSVPPFQSRYTAVDWSSTKTSNLILVRTRYHDQNEQLIFWCNQVQIIQSHIWQCCTCYIRCH